MDEKRVRGSKFLNRIKYYLWDKGWSGAVTPHDKYLSNVHQAKADEKNAKAIEFMKWDKSDWTLQDAVECYEKAAKHYLSAKEPKKAMAAYESARRVYRKMSNKAEKEGNETIADNFYKEAGRERLKANRIDRAMHGEYHGLEGKTAAVAVISILGILSGIFFLSPNLTGNAIGNMTNSTTNIIGVVLFAIGIVGAFFWFRNR